MSIQNVTVGTRAQLQQTVVSYIASGYVIANQSDEGALLQKQKSVNWVVVILGLIIPFLGWFILIIYVIVYASKPAVSVIDIRLALPSGAVPQPI